MILREITIDYHRFGKLGTAAESRRFPWRFPGHGQLGFPTVKSPLALFDAAKYQNGDEIQP